MSATAPRTGQVVIRELTAADAPAAAALSTQLGYPAEPDDIAARLRYFESVPDHAAFAACVNNEVVGWIDVAIVHHLQSPPFGEIGGLVVSEHHRSAGIGRELVRRAEQWIASRNISTVLVRSRSTRPRAHQFYLQLDYTQLKTSLVFTKTLPPAGTYH